MDYEVGSFEAYRFIETPVEVRDAVKKMLSLVEANMGFLDCNGVFVGDVRPEILVALQGNARACYVTPEITGSPSGLSG